VSGADFVCRCRIDAHGRSIITLMVPTTVLTAGAGPVGLTAAVELGRRGVDLRIVDPVVDPPKYAKAVGVQPRTLEGLEGMDVVGRRPMSRAGSPRSRSTYVVRPDGYLSFTGSGVDTDELVAHLCTTFDAGVSTTATPDLR
jgi:2-polyprenyl-6-methoxyphenol hydroxylase-like FAD-dependent oxidoreductase